MLKWFKKTKKKESSLRSNNEWVKSLTSPTDERAVAELRDIIIRSLKPALHKYIDRELNQFVEDTAQDALLKILDKVHTFRGESKFTTWAMKIAVREGLSELRRKKWKDISIQDLISASDDNSSEINTMEFSANDPDPEQLANQNIVLDKVMEIIEHELSDKQKMAIQALMIHGISVTVVAEQMGISRNALYKLVHDARVKLKKKMAEGGMDPENILEQM
jgi:RNA polymerase sigma-70 factor, ECF subfamily